MTLYRSAWGTVELWLSKVSTDEGRTLVVQQYTRGNTPSVQNRGNVPKVARCSILFDEMIGQKESGQDRLESLIALKELGKPQLFTHPIHGTYLAEIGEFTHEVDEFGVITGDASFTAVEDVGAVVVDPIGVSLEGGSAAIDAHADEADAQLAAVDLTSEATSTARGAGAVFDAATSARDVLVNVGNATERIQRDIENLELAADIALWPAMKALVMLDEATRAAGSQAMGDDSQLMTLRIDQPTSLRRLCAEIYGGGDAQAGYDEAMALNDIRTPARIPAGTELRMLRPQAA